MNFSILNESSLHNTLKNLYAEKYNGQTEVELYGHVYDILSGNQVIEIQTQNLAKLLPKTLDSLEKGLKVKIVYPLISKKVIETYKNQALVSKRTSPKKNTLYSMFRELTGIYPVLLHPDFSLDIVFCSVTEERIKTDELMQSKNMKRRFKKDWNKVNKRLDEIKEIKTFSSKEDYLSLLPENLPEEFSAKELKEGFSKNKIYPKNSQLFSNLILWVFSHMDLIELSGVKNRFHYYRIK